MASQDYILCIDIGADSIKASEFICTAANLELNRFAYLEYTNDSDDASAFESMLAALKELIVSNKFIAKQTYLSLSGQNALIPFIKIPAMSTDPQKIRELVTYEATSRIPYPLNEVVWDYQLIDNPDGGDEIDAMLVSVKNDEVAKITDTVESTGKKVKTIEVSPTAIYNAARANGIGENQCEMILNIGGKSSTLVFVDGPRFFVRSIPVAGNTITQQIAKEFNMSFAEADEIKRRHGFVALGGAYEDPESEMSATVSKIVRNVMTRLHGEINRSINVYRASQHGRKPEKLYLAGGSSIMAFTPRFFIEKLRIPVDYFNPFQVIPIGANVDKESLQELAHLYGETIGLALRHFRSTPIEISLIPETVKKQNAMRMKRPYFYASAVALLAYLGITYWALDTQATDIKQKSQTLQMALDSKKKIKANVLNAKDRLDASEKKFNEAWKLVRDRNQFLSVFNLVQSKIATFNQDSGNTSHAWLTEMTFSEEPETTLDNKEKQTNNNRSRNSRAANRKQAQRRMESGGEKWLNLSGYIVCADGVMQQIGNLTNSFLRKQGNDQQTDVFDMSEEELNKYVVFKQGIGGTNISSFKFSQRLKKTNDAKNMKASEE